MEIAARAGASGYIAGRSVWGDAVGDRPDAERAAGLARAADRLAALTAIVRAHGRPWAERIPVESIGPDWYESYGE